MESLSYGGYSRRQKFKKIRKKCWILDAKREELQKMRIYLDEGLVSWLASSSFGTVPPERMCMVAEVEAIKSSNAKLCLQ